MMGDDRYWVMWWEPDGENKWCFRQVCIPEGARELSVVYTQQHLSKRNSYVYSDNVIMWEPGEE